MTKREKSAIALSVIFLGIGAAISMYYSKWHFFQRSGSLVVVVGVWFTFVDLREKVLMTVNSVEKLFKNEKQKLEEYLRKKEKTEEQAKALIEQLHDALFVKDLPVVVEDTRKRLKFVESSILIVGTVVWGFGDFLDLLYCRC
ncbi:MAG: hypothetical protein OEZ58_17855 [Gammaproteobacteria bacterium]|nr:hypothetical protein [Gammaproteobacteria bacterium]